MPPPGADAAEQKGGSLPEQVQLPKSTGPQGEAELCWGVGGARRSGLEPELEPDLLLDQQGSQPRPLLLLRL